MSFGGIVLLAIGLALDAMAVAAAKGLAAQRILPRDAVLVAVLFGGFQALMPLLGWGLGSRLGPLVEAFDHWIAFALLGIIGAKKVGDGLRSMRAPPASTGSEELPARDPFALPGMLALAVATSVDALAVGISLPMLDAPLVTSLATIGITAAALSAVGLFAGRRLGARLGKRLDIAGGLLLVGIGALILVDHLLAD